MAALARWFFFWGYSVFLFAGSVLPESELPRTVRPVFPHFDKILHFGAYVALFAVTAEVFIRARASWLATRAVYMALFYSFVMGVVTEWAQAFVPTRTTDVLDWLANVTGMSFGWLLWELADRNRKRAVSGQRS